MSCIVYQNFKGKDFLRRNVLLLGPGPRVTLELGLISAVFEGNVPMDVQLLLV